MIRHLVLPGLLGETEGVLAFIARELSRNSYLNLMDQYHPCYRAAEYPPLDRVLDKHEYQQALAMAKHNGLHRLDRRQRVF